MEKSLEKHYDLLDIGPGASQQEIEAAYQNARWIYSEKNPEFKNFFSENEAQEIQAIIQEAYTELVSQFQEAAFTSGTDKVHQDTLPPQFYYNHTEETLESKPENDDFDNELAELEEEIDPSLENELIKNSFYDGLILKKLRIKKKVSLAHISQKTNIGIHHLNAIESNNFAALPASVFVKSYVKQYAEHLGLNPKVVSDSYIRLYNEFKQNQ